VREVTLAKAGRDRRARIVQRRQEEIVDLVSDRQRIDQGTGASVLGVDPGLDVGTRGILQRPIRIGNGDAVQAIRGIVARRRGAGLATAGAAPACRQTGSTTANAPAAIPPITTVRRVARPFPMNSMMPSVGAWLVGGGFGDRTALASSARTLKFCR
jgi:hypothetical protein